MSRFQSRPFQRWRVQRTAIHAALPKADATDPVRPSAGRASQTLAGLAQAIRESETITLGELVERLGPASLGLVLLMLTIPAIMPIPGPVGMILGSCLTLVALQVVAGSTRIWLPAILQRRRLPTRFVVRAIEFVIPWLVRCERRLSPRRWMLLSGRYARPFLGLCILVMAVIITLPIPFGNVLPVIALAVLAVALIERDGVAVMWALFLSAAALVWTGALFMFGAQGLDALGRLFA